MKQVFKRTRIWIATVMLFTSFSVIASTGEISGYVYDEKGNPFPFTPFVELFAGSQRMRVVQPDENGKFVIKPVEAGEYILKSRDQGYKILVAYIKVAAGKTTSQDFNMIINPFEFDEIVILPPVESMVQETMSSGKIIDYMTIKQMAVVPGDIVTITTNVTPGIIPTADGKDMYIRGSRRGTTGYIVDDQRVFGSFDVPSLSILGVTVYTGGIPAMYGDVTGGLVVVTTKSYTQGMMIKMKMKDEIIKNKAKEGEEEKEVIIKQK